MAEEMTWKCSNYGNCALADRDEPIKLAPGAEPRCPECGKELTQRSAKKAQRSVPFKALVGAGAAAALALAGWFGFYGGDQGTEDPSAPAGAVAATSLAPTPAPASAAPATPAPFPPGAAEAFQRATEALTKGQWDQALAAANEALRLKPDYAEALLNRSAALIELGKLAEAEADLATAARMDANNPLVAYNRAAISALRKDVDRAIAELEQALTLGFKTKGALETDANFKSLHPDPRFRDIVARVQTKP